VKEPRIAPAVVERLIAAQFPQWSDLPVRPVDVDGWDNCTFHLGDGMTVRLPSHDAYSAQVAKEHRWLPWLAERLPVEIPTPLAMGAPSDEFPRPWSVYRWIDGQTAAVERISDLTCVAADLAVFLRTLQRLDAGDGPLAGAHNFFRGGSLEIFDVETHETIAALGDKIRADVATEIWSTALRATWNGPPVWLHGDVTRGNLLVRDGRLAAVIDFGCCAVGDPACDVVIAWTLFSSESRRTFRDALGVDEATWLRGRGWLLWRTLLTLNGTDPVAADYARRVFDALVSDV
jgi:aminoglycoside phosphotransferase (APT) family kinase protein